MLCCSITVNSDTGKLLRAAKVIVWDEAPMCHRHAYEAFDRTLKDIMKADDPRLEFIPFGGKASLFSNALAESDKLMRADFDVFNDLRL